MAGCGILDDNNENNNVSDSDIKDDEDYQPNNKDGGNATLLFLIL